MTLPFDPYGEWRNPEDHPDIVQFLLEGRIGDVPLSYATAVGFIRTRPTGDNAEATRFWASTTARGAFLYALLSRGSRSLEAVERELGIANGKTHYYLQSFNFRFEPRPRRRVPVLDYDGEEHYEGRILWEDPDRPGHAMVSVYGLPGQYPAQWSPSSWAYRSLVPLPRPAGIIPIHFAAEVAGTTPKAIVMSLRAIGGASSQRRAYACELAQLYPDVDWAEAVLEWEGRHYSRDDGDA